MPATVDPELGVSVAADAVERAKRAGATAAKALHSYTEQFEVNFDTGEMNLARSTVSDGLTLTVYENERKGTAELTGRDHDTVEEAVGQALRAARASEPDPANVLPGEQAEPAESRGDASPDKEAMVDAVATFLERLREDHPDLLSWSSNYSFANTWSSYANSEGRTQHARAGHYELNLILVGRRDGASTSFNSTSLGADRPITDIAERPPIRQCLQDTDAAFGARPVPETFVGHLILTPSALSQMLGSVVEALGGLALLKKTSPFLDQLGEAVACSSFSLLHRPAELAVAEPFDGEGFPNAPIDIISSGVLRSFLIDWYISRKLERPMTSGLTSLVVEPGEEPLEEIIAGCERGIVLGRFSGGTPNQALDFSGVAKNSFYVEAGRVVCPVSETMIAGNLVRLLRDCTAVSRQQLDFGRCRMPWLSSPGVTISTR